MKPNFPQHVPAYARQRERFAKGVAAMRWALDIAPPITPEEQAAFDQDTVERMHRDNLARLPVPQLELGDESGR